MVITLWLASIFTSLARCDEPQISIVGVDPLKGTITFQKLEFEKSELPQLVTTYVNGQPRTETQKVILLRPIVEFFERNLTEFRCEDGNGKILAPNEVIARIKAGRAIWKPDGVPANDPSRSKALKDNAVIITPKK
jgi:hypothetical protein